MAKQILKIENSSKKWLYGIFIIPLLVAALSQFNLIDLSSSVAGMLSLLGGLFLASEVGIRNMITKRKITKNPVMLIGALVSVLVIVTSIIGLAGLSLGPLATIQGVVNIALILYAIVVAFS